MHSFQSMCGETFDNIIRDGFNRDFHAFEQGCLSEANPLMFLDAIMVRAPSWLVLTAIPPAASGSLGVPVVSVVQNALNLSLLVASLLADRRLFW
jgi:hypothetical protein